MVPTKSKLGINYPNPSNQETSIPYELENNEDVIFTLTDNSGRIVMNQHEGHKSAGKHLLSISTEKLTSGVYFYSMKAGNFVDTKSMVVN